MCFKMSNIKSNRFNDKVIQERERGNVEETEEMITVLSLGEHLECK